MGVDAGRRRATWSRPEDSVAELRAAAARSGRSTLASSSSSKSRAAASDIAHPAAFCAYTRGAHAEKGISRPVVTTRPRPTKVGVSAMNAMARAPPERAAARPARRTRVGWETSGGGAADDSDRARSVEKKNTPATTATATATATAPKPKPKPTVIYDDDDEEEEEEIVGVPRDAAGDAATASSARALDADPYDSDGDTVISYEEERELEAYDDDEDDDDDDVIEEVIEVVDDDDEEEEEAIEKVTTGMMATGLTPTRAPR
jgi:hypothetical protein